MNSAPVMDKFSERIQEDSEKPDAQADEARAALEKIKEDEWKRLTRGPVLAPASGGTGTMMPFA
jgi:hypothetical protein